MDPWTLALIGPLLLKGAGRLAGGDAGTGLEAAGSVAGLAGGRGGEGADLLNLGGGEGISPSGGLDLLGDMGGATPGADAGSGVPWSKLLALGALKGVGNMGQGGGGQVMQVTSPIGSDSTMRRSNPFASMMQPRTFY